MKQHHKNGSDPIDFVLAACRFSRLSSCISTRVPVWPEFDTGAYLSYQASAETTVILV